MFKLSELFGAVLCAFLLVVPASGKAPTSPTSGRQVKGKKIQPAKPLELTKSDVFALNSWSGDMVSVHGFTIGMTRSEVLKMAARDGLRLSESTPPGEAPCQTNQCDVEKETGFYIGVSLHFDADETLSRIDVSLTPEDAAPEVREVAITKRFKGKTYQFFNHYSDKLRIDLLGPGVLAKRDSRLPPKVPGVDEVYDYPSRGLRIYASIDETPAPVATDLTISFMRPQARTP